MAEFPSDAEPKERRRGALIFAAAMAIGIVVIAVVLLSGGDDEGSDTASSGDCVTVEAPGPKKVDLEAPKAARPAAAKVVFETNCGSFTVTLDSERAPKTTASFQYLAEQGVYDDTTFHRIVPGFVVQGGDPAGDGTGGPGYTITERPPRSLSYTRGLVAMAKSGTEPPGTSGSQFFVVTAPADANLPPDYALVGEVTDGFDTVLAIEALADPSAAPDPSDPSQASEQPVSPVVIESTTVEG